MLELVVARYTEDLRWLRKVPRAWKITVYNKGPLPEGPPPGVAISRLVTLENVGREAHTYLHHIANNYAELAPYTLFCQGRPFDHAYDFHSTLREMAQATSLPQFQWLGHIVDTDDNRGRTLYVPWSKNPERTELDMAGCHGALFDTPGPEQYTFRLGAQFLVARELIWSRPRHFWENAGSVAANFPDAAHCLERMWDKLFGVPGVPSQWIGRTIYLKPVKRIHTGESGANEPG